MDIDKTPPLRPAMPIDCAPNSPLFNITSKAIDIETLSFTEEFYPKADAVVEPSKNPYIITGPPDSFTSKDLQAFAKDNLPDVVTQPLFDINGKKTKSMKHKNISFTSEYRFRHIIPMLLLGNYLDEESMENLHSASMLAKQFSALIVEYGSVNTDPIRGFENYKDFRDETELNKERIRLHSAALLQHSCDVEKLVYYLGGPHVGANRNIPKILKNLKKGVSPTILAELERVYKYGSPRKINATNTEKNLKEYYHYGNHESANENPKALDKVVLKDHRRGNTLLVDKRLFPYIPNSHISPQGLADLYDLWKEARHISDCSHHIHPESMAINDWTNKSAEPPVYFAGSFLRFLIWVYNVRISYPNQRILLGDDDMTNAFRFIKNNPSIVAMCGFMANGLLGFSTGQCFGACFSPPNFDQGAKARQEQAEYLWMYESDRTLERATKHTSRMVFEASKSTEPFEPAFKDELNTGVFNNDGSRKPPVFPMQVDDCMYADVDEHFKLTAASSIISLEDTFGEDHPCQEKALSEKKFNPVYNEERLLVGHEVNTRRMVVIVSEKRQAKVVSYLTKEGWTTPGSTKTIREACTVLGLIGSAAEYHPWARAQLFILQNLVREELQKRFLEAQVSARLRKTIDNKKRRLPTSLLYRMSSIQARTFAEYMYRNGVKMNIGEAIVKSIKIIIYSLLRKRWECPIGHIVPRSPTWTSTGDSSELALSVYIKQSKVWCMVPFGKELSTRIKGKDREVFINSLEYMALQLASIIVNEIYEENPEAFPSCPTHRAKGDNTPSISWFDTFGTASSMGQNQIRLHAEYSLTARVKSFGEHLPGEINFMGDDISRPNKFFNPPLTKIHDVPFHLLVKQVCLKHPILQSYRIFLLSPELFSALSSSLSKNAKWERPQKPQKNGQLVPAAAILSTGASSGKSTTRYFL